MLDFGQKARKDIEVDMRELDFNVTKAVLKNAYGTQINVYENTNKLPINTCRDHYDSNLGILYIHEGKGKLSLDLALKPLLHLKAALLHESFINELDKALVGEKYNTKLFKNAVDEFKLINNFEKEIKHDDFIETLNKLIANIA